MIDLVFRSVGWLSAEYQDETKHRPYPYDPHGQPAAAS